MRLHLGYPSLARWLGVLLLVAAGLKGYALSDGTTTGTGWLSGRGVQITVVLGELLLGLALLAGLAPRVTWWLAVLGFLGFAAVALSKGLAGEASCGCFGKVSVNPWWLVGLDLAAVGALLAVRPRPETPGTSPRWAIAVSILGLSIGGTVAGFLLTVQPTILADDGGLVGAGTTVALAPESWRGKRCPLLPHTDIGARLNTGTWVVLLHRADCNRCAAALPAYLQLGHELAARDGVPRVALLGVPPCDEPATPPASPIVRGQLSDARTWQVSTPWFLRIRDGVVEVATQDPEVLLGSPLVDGPVAADRTSPGTAFPDYRGARQARYLAELACGPQSLLACLRTLGVALTPEDTARVLAAAGDRGVDLLDLKRLAEERGVHALGVRTTLARLAELGLPAVVHNGEYAFVAVVGYTADGPRVVDPGKHPVIVPESAFAKRFGRQVAALLLSRQPLSAANLGFGEPATEPAKFTGPHLRLERTVLSVGRVYTRVGRGTLRLFNDGDAPLEFHKVSAGCPGSAARVDHPIVPPGGSTVLHFELKNERLGGWTCGVVLETNQPDAAQVVVPVRGFVEQAVLLERPAVSLTNVSPGDTASTEIGLDVAEPFDVARIRVVIPAAAPWAAVVRSGGSNGPALHLTWKGAQEPGWHRHKLEVLVDGLKDALPTPLHVGVEIVPAVMVSPPILRLSAAEAAGTWSRRVTFQFAARPAALSVTATDAAFRAAIRVDEKSVADRETTVELSPVRPGAIQGWQGKQTELVFRFGSGQEARVRWLIGDTPAVPLTPRP